MNYVKENEHIIYLLEELQKRTNKNLMWFWPYIVV